MFTDQFSAILKELEPFFKCSLSPDRNNSCLIRLNSGIKLQLEMDRLGESLLIACRIGVLPHGRFRENFFREALKSNGLDLSGGIFGFSKKSEQLILFAKIPVKEINYDKLVAILSPLILKANHWVEAFNRGEIPTVMVKSSSSPFNLIR